MASWIKMEPVYRPKVGEELLATFSDWGGGIGTMYQCTAIIGTNFTVRQLRIITTTEVTEILDDQKKTFVIPFEMIPIINLHRKFNMGRE